jgi:YhcH/YjgK/YiaL family protein
MIITDLEHLPQQVNLTVAVQNSLKFLQDPHSADLQAGRVEIDGKTVYAMIQAYETLPAGSEVKFEAHRQYIDIQYMAAGEEVMGWVALEELPATTPYDAEKDVVHGLLPPGKMTPVRVRAGQAAVFFPEDAHAPKLAVSTPAPVKKIVIKVAVEAMRGAA